MSSSKNETHPDFIVFPARGGVKLIKPLYSAQETHTFPSVKQLFNLKLHIYFLNTDSVIQNINEETIKNCGYLSLKDTINKSVRVAAKSETAELTILHDKNVLTAEKMIISEENFIKRIDDESFHAVSIKYPWYNQSDKIIGIFGCSFIPSIHGLSAPLKSLIETGLFNSSTHESQKFPSNVSPTYQAEMSCLSRREQECLKYLLIGNSAKMIASKINRSVRTVEHHLENIKIKLKVNTKYELINKALKMGFSHEQ